MIPKNIFPWQIQPWQQVWHQKNRLPHALLLIGLPGLGKKIFAMTLAQALLCHQADAEGNPCFDCHHCHLIRAQSHPDFRFIEPEENTSIIKIDQIRDVVQFANETAMQSGYRIIIIHPAGAMNIYAANALLKILEEPPAKTLFILINEPSLRLPATILSRCQKIIFNRPAKHLALSWLQAEQKNLADHASLLLDLANGAPLKAIDMFENNLFSLRQDFYQGLMDLSQHQKNPLQLATQFFEQNSFVLLNFLLSWLQDLLRLKLTDGKAAIVNQDYEKNLSKLSISISKSDLLCYISLVQKSSQLLASFNLNRQLLWEKLFIHYKRYNVSC